MGHATIYARRGWVPGVGPALFGSVQGAATGWLTTTSSPGTIAVASKFTSLRSGVVDSIGLVLWKDIPTNQTWQFEVRRDAAGVPSTVLAHSAAFNGAAIADSPAWFALPTAPGGTALDEGSPYWVGWRRMSGTDGNLLYGSTKGLAGAISKGYTSSWLITLTDVSLLFTVA